MSELRTLLSDTTDKVLKDLPADFSHAWARVAEAGLTHVMSPEDGGGFGGGWEDALIVVRAAGRFATPLPLGEAIVAAHLAGKARFAPREGLLVFSAATDGQLAGDRFTGSLQAVPFGRRASQVLAFVEGGSSLVIANRSDASSIEERDNPAGEPRDVLHFDDVCVETAPSDNAMRLFECGALLRTAQIAGAMDAALQLSVEYTRQRQQFGKPLASFQAIQQQLAVLAEETAASGMAAASAFRAMDRGSASFEIAAAKLRANRAVTLGAGIAHQVHGAMGFTAEYSLQHLTRRLWAWQSEFGNERHWADRIGAGVAARGPENFWADLVGVSDRLS